MAFIGWGWKRQRGRAGQMAVAIEKLRGEKGDDDEVFGWAGTREKVRDSYPKWTEWDKRIAELDERLDVIQLKK